MAASMFVSCTALVCGCGFVQVLSFMCDRTMLQVLYGGQVSQQQVEAGCLRCNSTGCRKTWERWVLLKTLERHTWYVSASSTKICQMLCCNQTQSCMYARYLRTRQASRQSAALTTADDDNQHGKIVPNRTKLAKAAAGVTLSMYAEPSQVKQWQPLGFLYLHDKI